MNMLRGEELVHMAPITAAKQKCAQQSFRISQPYSCLQSQLGSSTQAPLQYRYLLLCVRKCASDTHVRVHYMGVHVCR